VRRDRVEGGQAIAPATGAKFEMPLTCVNTPSAMTVQIAASCNCGLNNRKGFT
jgi:hypothetical protein